MTTTTTLIPTLFKSVSLIFSLAALSTGLHAILSPPGFATSFGIPLTPTPSPSPPAKSKSASKSNPPTDPASHYIPLLGARQLGTGLTLLVFAYQGKWAECATILSIIGVLVAGMDGWYIVRASGDLGKGLFHAGPGVCIAGLAGAALYVGL